MELKLNSCYLGDNRDVMRTFDKESIDLIVTSPPYHVSEKYEKGVRRGEYDQLLKEVGFELFRVLKNDRYAIINIANPSYKNNYVLVYNSMINAGFTYYRDYIWAKEGLSMPTFYYTEQKPFVYNYNPSYEHEFIMVFEKGTPKDRVKEIGDVPINMALARKVKSDVWKLVGILKDSDIGHGAAFPITLPLLLVEFFSIKQDVVLDPFGGTCTTALACFKLKRNYIMIEKDKKYIDLFLENIEKEKAQLDLPGVTND